MRSLTLAASVLVVASLLPAQDPGRATLRGVVHAAGGGPWAGAAVVLCSQVVPGCDIPGGNDRVEVRADERGRFEAQILEHWRYLVWAHGRPVEGRYRVSEPALAVMAGRALVLTERAEPLAAVQIEVANGQWTDRAPFRLLLLAGGRYQRPSATGASSVRDYAFPLVEEDGVFHVPPVPMESALVEVYGRDGLLVSRSPLVLAPGLRQQLLGRKPVAPLAGAPPVLAAALAALVRTDDVISPTRSRVTLPVPKLTTLRIQADDAGGAPIAGATVWQRVRGTATRIATADEEGQVVLRLPPPGVGTEVGADVFVSAPGRATMPADRSDGFALGVVAGMRARPPGDDGRVLVKLPKEKVVEARLVLGEGKPLVGQPVLLRIDGGPSTRDLAGSESAGLIVAMAVSDGQGAVRFAGQPSGAPRLYAVLDRAARLALAVDGVLPCPVAMIAREGDDSPGGFGLGTIDLQRLRRVDLLVLDVDGAPLVNAEIGVCEVAGGAVRANPLLRPTTDRRGRATMLVDDVGGLSLCIASERGWACVDLDATAGKGPLRLQARPALTVAGRVLDVQGEPMPRLLVEALPSEFAPTDPYFRMTQTFADRTYTSTDAEGRFRAWVPRANSSYSLVLLDPVDRTLVTLGIRVEVGERSVEGLELRVPAGGR